MADKRTGRRTGPAAHTRYFQLKQWSSSQKEAFIEQHKAAYTRYDFAFEKKEFPD
jgi:predicted GIY-YIG superfamily endonuclease